MLGAALSFALLELLPINFPYWAFAGVLLLSGLSMGCFASPNRAAVMNSLPTRDRGAGGGMNSTFQNSAQVFSIGIFFSLMISGLAALPAALTTSLEAHHVPADAASAVATSPPVSVLFAAFLGYNPIEHLLGPAVIAQLPPGDTAVLTGTTFFPTLISGPFEAGLHIAFGFAIAACLVAAASSLSRGSRYVAVEEHTSTQAAEPALAHHGATGASEVRSGLGARPARRGAMDRPAERHEADDRDDRRADQ